MLEIIGYVTEGLGPDRKSFVVVRESRKRPPKRVGIPTNRLNNTPSARSFLVAHFNAKKEDLDFKVLPENHAKG